MPREWHFAMNPIGLMGERANFPPAAKDLQAEYHGTKRGHFLKQAYRIVHDGSHADHYVRRCLAGQLPEHAPPVVLCGHNRMQSEKRTESRVTSMARQPNPISSIPRAIAGQLVTYAVKSYPSPRFWRAKWLQRQHPSSAPVSSQAVPPRWTAD
jgi:hypothetical protein